MRLNKDFDLSGRIAVVTGASSGIGRAIALTLAHQRMRLCLVGRDIARLSHIVAEAQETSEARSFQLDLSDEKTLGPLLDHLKYEGKVDVLVHSAGVIREGLMEHSRIEDLDVQFSSNVRAPYMLTRRLLSLLSVARGQIVFINSSVGLSAKRPEIGQYGATKHALRAIADSLREELNPKGIRVLTVYLGRTATPMQESLARENRKIYLPEKLLQPEDVASVIVRALTLPKTAEVTDISIRPMNRSDATIQIERLQSNLEAWPGK